MKYLEHFLRQNNLKSTTLVEQKNILRKNLLKMRTKQYNACADKNLWGNKQFLTVLKTLNISSNSELEDKFRVACFFPIRGELNFIPFAQPCWIFPRVVHDELLWFQFGDGTSDYIPNKWNIPEKAQHHCFEYQPEKKPLLCFVPGIAGDTLGYRIGYGQGFYDKFLTKHTNIISVFCLPSEDFLFDKLPVEEHDKSVNYTIY